MSVALFLETKNEFTEHLIDTITPFIYEGLNSIYKEAVKIAESAESQDKILLIFQKLLQSVQGWNQQKIEEETNRIKTLSNTSEYFDKLVKAVVKSNIILLTNSNTISNIIGQTFYNNFTTYTFIHRCYTECAKDAHNNPYLFYHDANPMDIKRNQMIIQQNIQSAITKAIRKILPISMILEEYLVNSMNIINEPPKVELIGAPNPSVLPPLPQEKPVSEKKIDPKLEKEVMNIIKSEGVKTDKQKIQAIMNINEIITSMEPNKPGEMSARNSSAKSKSKINVPLHLVEDDSDDEEPANGKLNASDKKLVNMNFDEATTVSQTNKKSASATSMSDKPHNKVSKQPAYSEVSERVDPSKVDLIEDYGPQVGGKKGKKKH
jgi:hypothetical protein